MNRSNFTRRSISSAGLLMLVLATDSALAQGEPAKPAKAKRVFTNDDLRKFGDKYGPDDTAPIRHTPSPEGPTEAGKPGVKASEPTTSAGEEQSKWVGKLKEAETALQKAKADQAKYTAALEKFEQKQRDAQTDFQKTLTRNQVADSLNNLNRATEELKQAEEKKAKLLAEGEQNGFRPGDLQETPPASAQQK